MLQHGHQKQRQRVKKQHEQGSPQRLGLLERHEDDTRLHRQNGDGFRCEGPLQPSHGDDKQEHTQTEGIIHDRRALQRADADRGGLHRLLVRVAVRRDDLAQIADQRRQDEGDVEAVDVCAATHLVQQVHHRVREENHDRRARQHHRERSHDDSPLLLRRRQVAQILRNFLLFLLLHLPLHRHLRQLSRPTTLHERFDEATELVKVEGIAGVLVEGLHDASHLLRTHFLAEVPQQHAQLLHVQRIVFIRVVAQPEAAQKDV